MCKLQLSDGGGEGEREGDRARWGAVKHARVTHHDHVSKFWPLRA